MARCFVGLGANQGQTRETFERVQQSLKSIPGVSLASASSEYRSRAMGVQAGEDFLNSVLELQTACSPAELLAELQTIETNLGRRREMKWGPRIIDLDLIYFDDLCLESEKLVLPHPHAWYRRFVLEPICEIAADFVHPVYSMTQQQLLHRIDRRPFRLKILGNIASASDIERLLLEFPNLEVESSSKSDEEASLVVSQTAEHIVTNYPVLNLEQVPGESAIDALRSTLEACLGHCTRIVD